MIVSHLTLIIMAAFVWYSGGIALLLKSGGLVKGAYLIDSQSMWTFLAPLLGAIAGLIKGKFIFSKSCKKNVWQCFRPGMLLFLAIIIPTGAFMSRSAAGNYTFLCFVAALDLSIAFALLSSSIFFWKLKAFSQVQAGTD